MRIFALVLLLFLEVALSGFFPLLLFLHGFCRLTRLEHFANALARLREREYAEERLERLRNKSAEEVKHSIIDDVRFEIIACAYALRFQFRLRELYYQKKDGTAEEGSEFHSFEQYSEEMLLADLRDFFRLVENRAKVDSMDASLASEVYLDMLRHNMERAHAEYEEALERYRGPVACESQS